MSFLAPFFLLGAVAIALPVVFHLIRRTTKERIIFSSLMFLLSTPPRVTKRSRLEHIFLLVLRCLVLGLLALGFARPFFPDALSDRQPTGPGKKIILLVDTSASMRREALWRDALARADEVLRQASPVDQVAVFTFDRTVKRLITFEQWAQAAAGERAAIAARRLAEITPGWGDTHLGNALVTAAETLEEITRAEKQPPGARQIVLISDLQEGSRLDTLQAYEWPLGVELVFEPLKARRPTNAGLQFVAEADDGEKKSAPAGPRVRVSNAADSQREQFQIGWARADGGGFAGTAVDVYVPPGQSRVLAAPTPPGGSAPEQLRLQGDDEDFDNHVFAVTTDAARVKVLYLGDESEKDTAQPLYFVKRAFPETRRQIVQIIARPADAVLLPVETDAALVIVADPLPPERAKMLRHLLMEGKTVLLTMKSPAAANTLAQLLDLSMVAAEEAPGDGYAMWSEINFQHPLFAPFADPRFSDFTKIHFWKHRRLDPAQLPGARMLARFDNGDAAFLEVPAGRGRLLVLTAGWQPADSQLAVSSKFVPLLFSVLEQSGGAPPAPAQFTVGDTVALTNLIAAAAQTALTILKPDGVKVDLPKGETTFTQTDQPGIYTIVSTQPPKHFAVNLSAGESRTAPMPVEELERLGVSLQHHGVELARQSAQKHLLNSELESRQKLWRWLMLTALLVLLAETWLAGRLSRSTPPAQAV